MKSENDREDDWKPINALCCRDAAKRYVRTLQIQEPGIAEGDGIEVEVRQADDRYCFQPPLTIAVESIAGGRELISRVLQ